MADITKVVREINTVDSVGNNIINKLGLHWDLLAELISAEPGNRLVISDFDGKLYVGPCDPVIPLTKITNGEITSSIKPVTGNAPATTVSNPEWTGTIDWSPSIVSDFEGNVVYTAVITITPEEGYTLDGVGDIFTIDLPSYNLTYLNGKVTIVFTATSVLTNEGFQIDYVYPNDGSKPFAPSWYPIPLSLFAGYDTVDPDLLPTEEVYFDMNFANLFELWANQPGLGNVRASYDPAVATKVPDEAKGETPLNIPGTIISWGWVDNLSVIGGPNGPGIYINGSTGAQPVPMRLIRLVV